MFKGKVVLVTGASSGIGSAAAARLAREGAIVVAAARRDALGRKLVEDIEAAGGNAVFVQTDVTREESVDALFDFIAQRFGRLDCAFNNAGVEASGMALPDTPVAVFDRVYATNVRGIWLCMRHEMRMMGDRGAGVILNMSSAVAAKAFAMGSVYVSSKHAVVGITRSASLEVAKLGIRINCLCPGGVTTEMILGWIKDNLDGDAAPLLAKVPMGRFADPDEIVNTVVWLLSDQASYVTGSVIVADGGLTVG
jgi:NAD(P)-dependent dehydrogenase (short-subunit alcohol dehydrogenase family)